MKPVALGHYDGVVARLSRPEERRVPSVASGTPLIIEPMKARDIPFLTDFLSAHSRAIIDDISTHGALLLRGFDVSTVGDFEKAMLSIKGMRGINDVFMSENGRIVVDGTRYVFYTNAYVKTGGNTRPPLFHNENYYGPDVPRYVAFACLKPSWFGGETALLDMAGFLSDLPERIQSGLAQESVAVAVYPIDKVAARYGRSIADVREFCSQAGLPVVTREGQESIAIYKPSVVEHPLTHERALALHTHEIGDLGLWRATEEAFAAEYAGLQWSIHRWCWRWPHARNWAGLLALLMWRPRRAWPSVRARLVTAYKRLLHRGAQNDDGEPRARKLFGKGDIQAVAQTMRRRCSGVMWKRGDVLIIDNMKMAHSGMPGWGPRDLKVIMCNCMTMPCEPGRSGVYAPRADDLREPFGAQLRNGAPAMAGAGGSTRSPDRPKTAAL